MALSAWILIFLREVYKNVGWLTKTKIYAAATGEVTLLTQAIKWAAIVASAIAVVYQIYKAWNAYNIDLADSNDYVTYS